MAQVTVNRTSAAEVGYDLYWAAWRRHTSSPLIVGCYTYDGKYSYSDIRRAYLRFNLDSTTWNSRVIDNAVFGIYHNQSVGTNTCTLHQASTEIDPTTGDISTVYSNAAGTSIGTISEGVGTWHTVNTTAHARNHKGGFCDFGITGDATSNGNYDSWLNVTSLPRLVIDYYTPVNGRAAADDAEIVGQGTHAGDLYQIHFRRNAGTGYRVVCEYVEYEEYSYAPYVQLQKLVSGTWTNIGSGVQSYSFMSNITVRVEGSSIKVSDSDGLLIDTTDTTYSAAGDWFVEYSNREVSYTTDLSSTETYSATVTAKARIKNTIAQTVTSKARVLDTKTATISSKSRIAKPEPSTVTARARILKTETAAVQARTRVVSTGVSAVTSKARLLQAEDSTLTARARVRSSQETSLQVKSRLKKTKEATSDSKARVLVTEASDITSKARTLKVVTATVQAKSRMKSTYASELDSKAYIYREEEQSVTARARIENTYTSTVEAKSLILVLNQAEISTKARVLTVESADVDAKAAIESATPQTILVSPTDDSSDFSPVYLTWLIQDYLDYNIVSYVQIDDTDLSFENLVLESDSAHNTGFEYYDGISWVPVSVNGIPPGYVGNEVRLQVQLVPGVYYWRARNCAVESEA